MKTKSNFTAVYILIQIQPQLSQEVGMLYKTQIKTENNDLFILFNLFSVE